MTKKRFIILGMHCSSCVINIDGELEDTSGVMESCTSYAKQMVVVVYDEEKISEKKIVDIIGSIGYKAELHD